MPRSGSHIQEYHKSLLPCGTHQNKLMFFVLFLAVGGTGPTSDTGWGCMLRCGQMIFAQALVCRHLGRGKLSANNNDAERIWACIQPRSTMWAGREGGMFASSTLPTAAQNVYPQCCFWGTEELQEWWVGGDWRRGDWRFP